VKRQTLRLGASVTRGGVARRSAPQTPLGAWIDRMVVARKLPSKEALRREIDISMPAFNEWQRPDIAAVPQQRVKQRIVDKLKLTNAERESLDEAIEAQTRHEKVAPPPPEEEEPAEGAEQAFTTSYTHLPLALAMMRKIPKFAAVVDLLPLWRGKDEDPTVEGWFTIANEMLTTLSEHGAEGIGDEDAGLGGGKLEALKKKGKKR
jgi:hypothetical protein